MTLFLAAILSFSFTFPDSGNVGTCSRPVHAPVSSDSVTVIWRAQPAFVTDGYMRVQVDSLRGAPGDHSRITIQCGRDSTNYWLVTFITARFGLKDGQPVYLRSPCPRTVARIPTK